MSLRALIEEVEAMEKRGVKFVCGFASSRLALSEPRQQPASPATRAQWDQAVANAMLSTRGNKLRATAMVAKRYPELRAKLVHEANAQRPVEEPRPVARATVSPSADFRQKVAAMVDGGMEKREAIKMLSRQMGLSEAPKQGDYFSTARRAYGR